MNSGLFCFDRMERQKAYQKRYLVSMKKNSTGYKMRVAFLLLLNNKSDPLRLTTYLYNNWKQIYLKTHMRKLSI